MRLSVYPKSGLSGLIWMLVGATLAVLIVWPLLRLIMVSIQDGNGLMTLSHYIRAFSADRFRTAAWNSLVLASSVGALSVLIATPMAWLTARTDMPGKRLINILVIGSLVTPGFLTAISWTFLAGPNAGLLNRLYELVTGDSSPLFNIFSMPGLVFVTFLECFPFAYIIIAAALKNVSTELEDAATMLGAGRWHTARRVTLPLVAPAIIAGFILAFLEAFALFSGPAMIGIPAQIYVLTTQIWALFQYPPELGVAAALAIPMLVLTAVLLILQRTLLGKKSYVTVTGKSTAKRLIRLGAGRWVAFSFCALVTTASVLVTYLVLGTYSISKSWNLDFSLGNLTWEHYRFVLFDLDSAMRSLGNSLKLAVIAATLAVALGAMSAYIAQRKLIRGARYLSFLAMAPMVIPSIVFAVGLFAAYTRQPLVLYGTLWILLIAYLTKFLPLAFMNASTAVQAVGTELEEAARISGATAFRTFGRITLPLISHGVVAGWLLVFTFSLRELSSSILLFTNQTIVVSVNVYDLYEMGSWGALSALGCLLLIVNLVVIGFGYFLLDRQMNKRNAVESAA